MIRNHSYSNGPFGNPDRLAEIAKVVLANVDYDTMIGTGLSGSLVVPALARALGKQWAIIRKTGESSHSAKPFEGQIGDRYIFVDDFIASGATRDRVTSAVADIAERWGEQYPMFVGSYLYDEPAYDAWRPNTGDPIGNH